MAAPRRSSPVRVRDVLLTALPELAPHMLMDGIRRDWSSIVGLEVSRHCRPGRLRQGALEVTVDNSPWLHELTLRSGEMLAALQRGHGLDVTSLRFALGPVAESPGRAASRPRRPPLSGALGPAEARFVESTIEPVADPTLAASIRRVLTKDILARRSLGSSRRPADGTPSEREDS